METDLEISYKIKHLLGFQHKLVFHNSHKIGRKLSKQESDEYAK